MKKSQSVIFIQTKNKLGFALKLL